MKRVAIFNEKGGVGKTTITAMMASYLAYEAGRRVCVLDFDNPSFHFMELRLSEIKIAGDPKSPLSWWLSHNPAQPPYDIISFPTGPEEGVYNSDEVFGYLRSILADEYDYVFYDFPGRFAAGEPVSFLAANGYVDFFAIPMDTDTQCRKSALVVAEAIQRAGIPLSLFWNRVSADEAGGAGERFRRGAEPFLRRGMEVMPEMIRDIRKVSRDSSEMGFIRSTLCFPTRYVNGRSPQFIPFFVALRERIDNA